PYLSRDNHREFARSHGQLHRKNLSQHSTVLGRIATACGPDQVRVHRGKSTTPLVHTITSESKPTHASRQILKLLNHNFGLIFKREAAGAKNKQTDVHRIAAGRRNSRSKYVLANNMSPTRGA